MKGYVDNAHGHSNDSSGSAPAVEGTSSLHNTDANGVSVPTITPDEQGVSGELGDLLEENDLVDEHGEEHVVEIRECPLCPSAPPKQKVRCRYYNSHCHLC